MGESVAPRSASDDSKRYRARVLILDMRCAGLWFLLVANLLRWRLPRSSAQRKRGVPNKEDSTLLGARKDGEQALNVILIINSQTYTLKTLEG